MRLARFIEENIEVILAEWVAFANTCAPAARTMDYPGLRDHAEGMLRAIVRDLDLPQSDAEQTAKSRGLGGSDPSMPETAAEVHGAGRAESGFSIDEMVSEYRALRASVLRLWSVAHPAALADDFDDVMRFNEAIDQSLAESITRFAADLDRSKEMFVAVLGHDLRTPLSAVLVNAQFLRESEDSPELHRSLAARVVSSAQRMTGMVDDLLDFTQSRLGTGIRFERRPTDLAAIVRDAVGEVSTANPGAIFDVHVEGMLSGHYDSARVSQAVVNILGNAVHHGDSTLPIIVRATPTRDGTTLEISNSGDVIPASLLHHLFSPFKRNVGSDAAESGSSHHLGLGLYIAERIMTAHGGTIVATSTLDDGTVFTLNFPTE